MQEHYTKFNPGIKGVKIKKTYILDNTYYVEAVRTDKRPMCCDRLMNIKDYRQVRIKDKNYGSSKVIINVKKQRYICPCCNRKETGSLSFVEKRHSISKNVLNELNYHFRDIKSFKQIAKDLGISLSSVLRYFMKLEVKDKMNTTNTIHFDEFKGNADKEKYQLAVYNEKRELLTILKDRKSKTIKEYLESQEVKPKRVVIDLFMQFRNVIKSVLPKVEIIADKYHYVRQMEWMLRDVRIRLYNQDIKYKKFKKYWKLISSNPEKLTKNQKIRIDELKSLSPIFKECYEYKVKFYKLIKSKTEELFNKNLEVLICELEKSGIKECLKLSKTYKNWKEEIKNSFKYKVDNGFVEGYNNKIKVIKRVSYGIRKFEILKKQIQLKISHDVECIFDPTC